MSYLHIPRINFGGLFFTNPNTINNYDFSYDTDIELTNAKGQYRTDGGQGGPGGWNPLGTARFYLRSCSVLGGVDKEGRPVAADPGDPLIGAPVATPSPGTPEAPDGVTYSLPKLVDLDPDMQIRSEVYGMRVWVQIPGSGAGFWGTMSVPQLRNMGGRVDNGVHSSWSAVGTLAGNITDVKWLGDASVSPLLAQFKAACAGGISYRLTIDLHQNNPANQFTSGDQLYYGRAHGTFGPAYPDRELAQVVPGRMLQIPPPPPSAAKSKATATPQAGARTREARLEAIANELGAAAASKAKSAPSVSLNASPALVLTRPDGTHSLAVDLGGASLLAVGPNNEVLGKYLVDEGIELGYLDGTSFTPFAAKPVSFTNEYVDTLIGNVEKSCYLVRNAGVVDVPLTDTEAKTIASAPLAVRVTGQLPLQELTSGYWIELSEGSCRLLPGTNTNLQMMVRQFGAPVTGAVPALTINVLASNWYNDERPFKNEIEPSTAVELTFEGELDANGLVGMQVAGTTPAPLGTLRTFMDSKVFFAEISDSNGDPIGDQAAEGYALSALLWNPYQPPSNPTWDADVGPILESYSRLYPGMKSIFDIGDKDTVLGSAAGVRERMSLPFDDPGYMPVTRDLSPSKVAVVVRWLGEQTTPKNA